MTIEWVNGFQFGGIVGFVIGCITLSQTKKDNR